MKTIAFRLIDHHFFKFRFQFIHLVAGLFSLSLVSATNAQFILNFKESEGTTTATFSGNWDSFNYKPNLVIGEGQLNEYGIHSTGAQLISYSEDNTLVGSIPWDRPGTAPVTARTGDNWGFNSQNGLAYAPLGYTVGQQLSGTMTFAGLTIADLGFGATSGVFTFGGTDIAWSTTAAVPEPGTFALLAGLICLAFVAGRRRGVA